MSPSATFRRAAACTLLLTLLCATPLQAAFWDNAGALLDNVGGQTDPETAEMTALSRRDISAAFKEALTIAITKAVDLTGATDGFWNNTRIRISEPKALQQTAGLLNQVGLADTVDDFRYTMNLAASQAAAEAMPVLAAALKKMTFADVNKLRQGHDHAVTDFFRESADDELRRLFLPIVEEKLNRVGVTGLYQEIVGQPLVAMTLGLQLPELDHYVTDKALDGLFLLIADEEQKIRNDPATRTSQLLKQVFGR